MKYSECKCGKPHVVEYEYGLDDIGIEVEHNIRRLCAEHDKDPIFKINVLRETRLN